MSLNAHLCRRMSGANISAFSSDSSHLAFGMSAIVGHQSFRVVSNSEEHAAAVFVTREKRVLPKPFRGRQP
jgi:hypothetical protein